MTWTPPKLFQRTLGDDADEWFSAYQIPDDHPSQATRMRAQRERTIQRAPAVVEFLRGAFFADGAEGESVHLACDIIEALGAELALAAGAEAATPSERCAAARRAFQSTADPAKGWRRVVRAVDASRPKEP